MDTTAGRLSKDVIRARYSQRRSEPNVESRRDNFMYFSRMPTVKLGASTIIHADTIICTDSIDCLSFRRDESTGQFLMNMRIFDRESKRICEITENTWLSEYKPWDFQFSGKIITFRAGPRKIIFKAALDSENCFVEITHLDMTLENSRVRIESGNIIASRDSFDGSRTVEVGTRFSGMACRAAIFLDNRQDVPNFVSEIRGFSKSFGGITIGRRANCHIQYFSVKTRGIYKTFRDINKGAKDPREAYIQGQLVKLTLHFPFWDEDEYYLNGVKLSQSPHSVDDVGYCEDGGPIEIFLIGAPDAALFSEDNGLLGYSVEHLARPPLRPHSFL
jgi:hypothetical protein